MVENRRICLDIQINSRPVQKFEGTKIYVSTGDSEDMENGQKIGFYGRPSRANVEPKLNDVIFAKMSNTDKTFLINNDLVKNIYSTGFFDVSSKKIYPRFLYYIIQSHEFDSFKNAYSEGTTQISISDKRLKKIRLTYETNFDKQIIISKFLNQKIGVINDMMSNIEMQKDNIIRYRDSLITEIVTKGLNSAVQFNETNSDLIKMKPSHWKLNKIKYVSFLVTDGAHVSPETDNGVKPFISTVDIKDGYIDFNNCLKTSLKSYYQFVANNCNPKRNDVLISKDGTVGRTVVVDFDEDFVIGSSLVIIRPITNKINPYYLEYFLRSNVIQDLLVMLMSGSALKRVSVTKNANLPILVPPMTEQTAIVRYLDEKMQNIQELLRLKEKKIEELKKYKKSLIYECVSGKMEVE